MSSRLASCALSSLTRRVGHMSLATSSSSVASVRTQPLVTVASSTTMMRSRTMSAPFWTSHLAIPSLATTVGGSSSTLVASMESPFFQPNRTMVTRKKRLAKRQKRKLAEKAAAKKREEKMAEGGEEQAAPQHTAWVDFQKSISVGGFQTGQTTKVRVLQKGESGQKLRDLKRREKMEMRMATKRPEMTDVRGGEYPVGRYSDEETERLLAMAYAAIPERAGRRGTRNLKRQKNRWFLVRKIRAKAKRQKTAAHFRAMDKRSVQAKELKAVRAEAPGVRVRDRNYQRELLQRWVENLQQHDDDYSERELIQAEATVIEQDAKA